MNHAKIPFLLLSLFSFLAIGAVPSKTLFEVTSREQKFITREVACRVVEVNDRLAAKATYPKYEKGRNEWPAFIIGGETLNGQIKLGEWDAFVLTVLNPYDEVMDLGISFTGNKKSYSFHVDLQPGAWNHWSYLVKEMIEQAGDELKSFNFFLTRPEKEITFYFTEAKLVKQNPPDDTKIDTECTIIDFEGDKLPECVELNGVTADLSKNWAKDGKQSLKLTYSPGKRKWPAFQLWTVSDSKIGFNLTPFSTLEFTTHSNCQLITPLKVTVKDMKGNSVAQDCLLSPGQENTWKIDLTKTGFDRGYIRQIDFYMSHPTETYSLFLDSIKLIGPPAEEISSWKSLLNDLKQEMKGMDEKRGQKIYAKMDEFTKRITAAQGIMQKPQCTLSELRDVAQLGIAIENWFNGNSRDISEERIILETSKAFPNSPFGIAVADSMVKVMIKDLPLQHVAFRKNIELELAKNEYESVQIVAIGNKDAVAGVEVGELRNGDYVLPKEMVSVSLVGHVETKKPPYPASYQGWWPDPLLDWQKNAKVAPHEAVSFWIRIKTPEDTKPGNFTGNIIVTADNKEVARLILNLHVFDFSVPSISPLDTAMDFRDHIRQVWGKEMSIEEHDAILDKAVDLLGEYKMSFTRIYANPNSKDVTKLDLNIRQLKRMKEKGLLRKFCIMYVGTPKDCLDVDDPRVQQQIDLIMKTLDYWVPIIKKEGLLEHAYIYGYDEIPSSMFPVMAKVFKAIKAKYPEIPLGTTAYDHSFGTETCLGGAVDFFTPLTPKYNPSMVEKARKQGTQVWWYTCIGPHNPYANWFVEYALIETRLLMGMMTAKFRPDGFLYYAITRWPENKGPIVDGPYTNWNPASFNTANGDGSILCAGPNGVIPTIRAENFRDGLEDYAYFLELEKRLKNKNGISPELRKQAMEALTVPSELVNTMSEYSHDPTLLRNIRRNVALMIEKLE